MYNAPELKGMLENSSFSFAQFKQALKKAKLTPTDSIMLLRKAAEFKKTSFADYLDTLFDEGMDLNLAFKEDGKSVLMIVCQTGTLDMVQAILSKPAVDLRQLDKRNNNAAFYALENKSKEESGAILRFILTRDASLVSSQAGNQTLLTHAIAKSKDELVKILLESGANPNFQIADTGNTALHEALRPMKNRVTKLGKEIVRLLLLHGADCSIKNKQNKDSFDYAEKFETDLREEIAKLQAEKLQPKEQSPAIQESDEESSDSQSSSGNREESYLNEDEILGPLQAEMQVLEERTVWRYEQAKREIGELLEVLRSRSKGEFSIEAAGAFAVGIWVQKTNVELLMVVSPEAEVNSQLERLQSVLKVELKVREVCITREMWPINIYKLTFELERHSTGKLRVEVTVEATDQQRAKERQKAKRFVEEELLACGVLRRVFFSLKELAGKYKLGDARSGGMSTYAMVITAMSMIRKGSQAEPAAKVLVDFLYYFGYYYNYVDSDVNLIHATNIFDSSFIPSPFRVFHFQNMCRAAYIALHANVPANRLGFMLDTHQLVNLL